MPIHSLLLIRPERAGSFEPDSYALGSTAIGMLGLRSFLRANLGRPTECLARLTVFFISIAIVIGPTPPGTGVIADATFWQDSKSQSPTMR